MKALIGVAYSTFIISMMALAILVTACGKDPVPPGPDTQKTFTVVYENVTVEGTAPSAELVASEKSKVETALRVGAK